MSQRRKTGSAYWQWRSATVRKMKSDYCLGPVIKRHFDSLKRDTPGSSIALSEANTIAPEAAKILRKHGAVVELTRSRGKYNLSLIVHLQTTDSTLPSKKMRELPATFHREKHMHVTHSSKTVRVSSAEVSSILGGKQGSISNTVYHYKLTLSVSCHSSEQLAVYLDEAAKAVRVLNGERVRPERVVVEKKKEKRLGYLQRMFGGPTPVEEPSSLDNIAALAALKTG